MDSYNSMYPNVYYEIGTPYMFYIRKTPKQGKPATGEHIEKYAAVLRKTKKEKGEGYCFADRRIGVVVGSELHDWKGADGFITVMFLGDYNGNSVYMTEKYITGYQPGVFCDNKEQHLAGGVVDVSGEDIFESYELPVKKPPIGVVPVGGSGGNNGIGVKPISGGGSADGDGIKPILEAKGDEEVGVKPVEDETSSGEGVKPVNP